MDLTDLQTELRQLETQLSVLQGEIEKMKPKREEKIDIDFNAITKLANHNLICRKNLEKTNNDVKKLLFSSLAFIVVQSGENISSKLLYLCRIANGSGFSVTAEELYTLGLRFSTDDMEALINCISDVKYSYLTELFIVANIAGEAATETIYAIADIANMMALCKEDLQAISLIAKSVLTNKTDYLLDVPMPNANTWSGQFSDYISEAWLASQRKICQKLEEKKNSPFIPFSWNDVETEIKVHLNNGFITKEGELLCTFYHKRGSIIENKEEFKANYNGIVAFIEYEVKDEASIHGKKYTDIIIGSYFDTYEQILAWHKEQQNNKLVSYFDDTHKNIFEWCKELQNNK